MSETRECAECYQLIRPTEARDGIEMHDGKYEFEWVHDNGPKIGGNPYCDLSPIARPKESAVNRES
jgi:hypothetical protein